jgi:hypothetical protein
MSKVFRPNNKSHGVLIWFLWPLKKQRRSVDLSIRHKRSRHGIFLWPAWGLYDAIKEDKIKHNNFLMIEFLPR